MKDMTVNGDMGEYSSTWSHALLRTEAYPVNALVRRQVLIILKTLYRGKYRICNYIAEDYVTPSQESRSKMVCFDVGRFSSYLSASSVAAH